MQKGKKKNSIRKYIIFAAPLICGAIIGVFLGSYLSSSEGGLTGRLFSLALIFFGVIAALYIQIIIHEAGHLVFGLISGYRFSSFRIGSFMLVKVRGKMRIKRLTIAGTGGQCLMIPPEGVEIPVILYHMGGAFLNVITAAVFLALLPVFGSIPYLSAALLVLGAVGIMVALLNGVPMKLGMINNDGHNALLFRRDSAARHAFCVQIKTVVASADGVRLRDMPEELFLCPLPEEMKDSMAASMGVLAVNRLMDSLHFAEADKLMAALLEVDALLGLHRNLLVCDKIFCELLGENRAEALSAMLDKRQRAFMKAMRKFPAVLRTEYAYAVLAENNTEKGANVMAEFDKMAKTYPYAGDIESERELMDIARTRASGKGDVTC